MARPGVAVHPGEASERRRRATDLGFGFDSWDHGRLEAPWDHSRVEAPWDDDRLYTRSPLSSGGVPGRRTVTITGQGAEGYASRNGTRPSMAQRHRPVKRYERAGFRPDRAAMWAVLLGVVLLLAAVTSAHAAVLAAHHALALR
jgi:hypothetical protein